MMIRKTIFISAAAVGLFTAFAVSGITAYAADTAPQEETPLTGYSALRKDSLVLGANATMLGRAEGGQAPYSYRYSFKSVTAEEWTDIPAENNATLCRFSPDVPGRYDVRCIVTDAEGSTAVNEDRLLIWQETGKEFENTTAAGGQIISLGQSIVLEGTAEGGRIPYEYKYFIKSDKEDSYRQIRAYGEAAAFEYKPETAGYYTVKLRVREAGGEYKDRTMRLTVIQKSGSELKNLSSADKKTISEKESVTLKASAFGGTAPYEYKYLYKKNNGSWTQLKGYSSKRPSLEYTPNGTGYYKFKVRIRDYEGKVCDKEIELAVKKPTGRPLSNESTASSLFIAKNGTLSLNAKAAGGVMPYKYKFYMYSEDEKRWQELNRYGTVSTYRMKLTHTGRYRFKVNVRDLEETVRSKTFNVEVYSELKQTTAYCDMLSSASWSSRVVGYVPRGSKVCVYSKSGNWYKVTYGETSGWLYCSAFGINDGSGLEAMADRIIAERGRNITDLFNYANWMGYTGMNDLGYRENVAYILKYRRGACYQRASLLCFLLDRAGYTVIRVSDGIDKYTGYSPHNWVIISTSQGWRHIDPTPVIGLRTFCLVTDYAIDPYFAWDRKKYPECK